MTIFLTDLILDTLLTISRIPDTTSATEVVMLISLSPTCKNTFVGQNLVASSKHGLCINDFVVVPFWLKHLRMILLGRFSLIKPSDKLFSNSEIWLLPSIATRSEFPWDMDDCLVVESLETDKGTVAVKEVCSDEGMVKVEEERSDEGMVTFKEERSDEVTVTVEVLSDEVLLTVEKSV